MINSSHLLILTGFNLGRIFLGSALMTLRPGSTFVAVSSQMVALSLKFKKETHICNIDINPFLNVIHVTYVTFFIDFYTINFDFLTIIISFTKNSCPCEPAVSNLLFYNLKRQSSNIFHYIVFLHCISLH